LTVYVLRRLGQAAATLLGVALVTFLLVRVTGDPAHLILGDLAPPEAVAAFNREHGLDRPLAVQFLAYVAGVARGDLGLSLRYKEPVLELFLARLPATLELGLAAYLFMAVAGIAVGVLSAVRAGTWVDTGGRFLALFGQAIPGFYFGLLLILAFSLAVPLFPTGGRGTWLHLVLPAFTLGTHLLALLVRFTRAAMLDVLHQDYVRTARAKGLSERVVVLRHALANTVVPLATILAVQAGVVFSGAVVTEQVFSWPGVGRFALQAIYTRDFPVVQGTVLILTAVVVLLNVAVDLSYAYLDPRIRYR
jgi:ABC-type dipeptide/oligopeptide/nickel transport system permease component